MSQKKNIYIYTYKAFFLVPDSFILVNGHILDVWQPINQANNDNIIVIGHSVNISNTLITYSSFNEKLQQVNAEILYYIQLDRME